MRPRASCGRPPGVHLPPWACAPVGAAALVAGLALVPELPPDGRPPSRRHPVLELALRMLAAAALVTALTEAAGRLGPAWSGLLAPFPVATSVLLAGNHWADGPASLPETLRGLLLGLFGFVAFLLLLAFGLGPLGVARGFELGLAASLAVSGLAAWLSGTRRAARSPAPPPAGAGGRRCDGRRFR